jgi:hypothetical protein
MPFSLKTHIPKRGADGESKIARYVPYTRIRGEGADGPLFIQGGYFYTEGGQHIKAADLPDWVEDEVAKLTPAAKRECGLEK